VRPEGLDTSALFLCLSSSAPFGSHYTEADMKKFEIDHYRLPLTERIAYSPDEAARLIGFSRNGLHPYLAAGKLRSFKIGPKKRLILRSDLLAFVQGITDLDCAAALPSTDKTDGGPG
jgi:excisionase family DNA binding protein